MAEILARRRVALLALGSWLVALVLVAAACGRDGSGGVKPLGSSGKRRAVEGMPLASITIDAPTSSEAAYLVDDDTVLQVLLLALDGELPVSRIADGYRVNRVLGGSVLSLVGLRNADEVVAVNGVPLSDPRAMSKAYPLLRSARAITLSVRRAGNVITLNYRVDRSRASRRRRRPARPPSARPLRSVRPSVSSKAPRFRALPEALARQIKRIDDTHFEIKRALVDEMLLNQAELMRSARILPVVRDGNVVGIRLFGIRPTNLLALLGFRNGDSVHTINGKDVTSPDKALEAYAELRKAKRLVVKLTRRGKPVSLHFRVVP